MTERYYAHSIEGKPPSEWQPLEEHLQNVAKVTAEFAEHFDARTWGTILVKRLVNVVLGFGNMIFSYLGLYLTQYVV